MSSMRLAYPAHPSGLERVRAWITTSESSREASLSSSLR